MLMYFNFRDCTTSLLQHTFCLIPAGQNKMFSTWSSRTMRWTSRGRWRAVQRIAAQSRSPSLVRSSNTHLKLMLHLPEGFGISIGVHMFILSHASICLDSPNQEDGRPIQGTDRSARSSYSRWRLFRNRCWSRGCINAGLSWNTDKLLDKEVHHICKVQALPTHCVNS